MSFSSLGSGISSGTGNGCSACQIMGIECVAFEEPDDDLGLTAICTEPITGEIRRLFRHIALWQATITRVQARGPPATPLKCFYFTLHTPNRAVWRG